MKRQRRSRTRSRKSSGPAAPATSPPRSGEPTHPHRSGAGGTASSSARYGESASYASAAPERMHHRRSEGGSPSCGEENTVMPKLRQKKEGRRYVWIPRRLLQKFEGDFHAALKAYADEGGIVPAPFTREAGADHRLQYDHSSSSSSSSRPGDAQEDVPFDGEETSLPLKMDKKPESTCSRELCKIADDEEDGQSDKKPCPAVEDEEHSGRIGVHAIEEHKQEQESATGHVQALLDMDDENIFQNIRRFDKRLKYASAERRAYSPEYEERELLELYQQLALYRIRAYELTVDGKLAQLDDLKLQYPPSKLYNNNFFEYYERRLEWYFDLERCKNAQFDNYQRLVLRDHCGYVDWDLYHGIVNTYEEDLAYVQYFEEVAKQTKWVEDYLVDSTIEWQRVESVVYMQALEIAAGFPDVSRFLVSYGFREYICSILSDCSRKGLDGLYFEIWKRVAKGKMSFKEALMEIHSKGMFPLRSSDIKHELENTPYRFPIKDYAADDKARQLIREAVVKIVSTYKQKFYLDYARKKLDIARDILFDSQRYVDFQQAHT